MRVLDAHEIDFSLQQGLQIVDKPEIPIRKAGRISIELEKEIDVAVCGIIPFSGCGTEQIKTAHAILVA